jgi:hypothetical protein
LRDLVRLAEVRIIRHRAADWLVRTDSAPAVAALFSAAHIALPPRIRRRPPNPSPPENATAAPGVVPRRLEFRRNAAQSTTCKIQVFKSGQVAR